MLFDSLGNRGSEILKKAATFAALAFPPLFSSTASAENVAEAIPAVTSLDDVDSMRISPPEKIPFRSDYHGQTVEDPYQWLENTSLDRAMTYVNAENRRTQRTFEGPLFEEFCNTLRARQDCETFATPSFGSRVFVLTRSTQHPKGRLSFCAIDDYLKSPNNPPFEHVLDLDKLCQEEGRDWIFVNAYHTGKMDSRCLVSLSYGGTDKVCTREFDLKSKKFLDDGFTSIGKTSQTYLGPNNAILYAAEYAAEHLSSAGYPLKIRYWDRTKPLAQADTILTGSADRVRMTVSAMTLRSGKEVGLITSVEGASWTEHVYAFQPESKTTTKLPLPGDHDVLLYHNGHILFRPNTSFKVNGTDMKGGIVAFDVEQYLQNNTQSFIGLLTFHPSQACDKIACHNGTLYVSYLENASSHLCKFPLTLNGNSASYIYSSQISGVKIPEDGWISSLSSCPGKGLALVYENFVTPKALYLLDSNSTELGAPIRAALEKFDTSKIAVEQRWTTSADGTKVPYFVIDGRANRQVPAPTILSGYGGFLAPETPYYSWSSGALWLEHGGVMVSANLRGGGEFGPDWHTAALKENRKKAYEDFIAVAEDLIARGITTKEKLGISGGSNGGLLVAKAMVMRPDLFNAVDCQVPLLDMLRYQKIGPGPMWVKEYGSSDDPNEIRHLKEISPYHNVKQGINYPATLYTTSVTDDRVYPGHARKMTALMQELGNDDTYFLERPSGGHDKSDFNSWIEPCALRFSFFHHYLFADNKSH